MRWADDRQSNGVHVHDASRDIEVHVLHLTRSVDVELRDRAGDLWAVVVDGGHVLNASGGTEHEPLPSSRDDAFLARTRFPLDDAIALAEAFIGIHTKYQQPTAGADIKPLAAATLHVDTGVGGGPPRRGRRMNGFPVRREDEAKGREA